MEMLKKKVNELTNRQILFNPKTKRKKELKKYKSKKEQHFNKLCWDNCPPNTQKKKYLDYTSILTQKLTQNGS